MTIMHVKQLHNETASNYCMPEHDLDQYIFPTIYISVIVLGVPANLISLYVSYLQVIKRNELGIYLFNLSFSDLLYVLVLPLWVDFSLQHDSWRFPDWLCSLSAFCMHTNLYSSAGFLTCISLDRYLAVVYPLRFQHLRTRKMAVLVSLLVWITQGASNSIILAKKNTFNNTKHLLCYDIFPMEPWKSPFSIFNVFIGHFLPMAIMVFCYYKIYIAVQSNQATVVRDKHKIKHLLLTIVVTFILSFTPYHIVLLMRSIREPGNCMFAQKIFTPYKLTVALSSVNCLADPLLYCFVSETGRADAKAIIHCCQPQVKPSSNSELPMSVIAEHYKREEYI